MVNGNSKYARKYEDGDNVYAHGETHGIFVFETIIEAKTWMGTWELFHHKRFLLLKVIPLGRGSSITWVADKPDTDTIDHYYNNPKTTLVMQAPYRTMAYPGVHVIGPVYI